MWRKCLALSLVHLLLVISGVATDVCSGGMDCASACPLTCQNYTTAPIDCPEPCSEGCACPEGKVELDGVCVNNSTCAGCSECEEGQKCSAVIFQGCESVTCKDPTAVPCSADVALGCSEGSRCLTHSSTSESFCLDSCFMQNGGCPKDQTCYLEHNKKESCNSLLESCYNSTCQQSSDGADAETSVCPVGWVLNDCGSLCQRTCEDYLTNTHRDCPEGMCGMPSCVCPEGLVVFKDRCVDPLECHSLIHHGVVGFEKTVYSVSEDTPDGVVELCAVVYTADNIKCPIPFPFILQASVLSKGYNESLVFAQCERRVCANLTVENDGTLEEMESFEVTLERTPGLDHRIILAPVTAEINIIDDDDKVVGFEETVYSVPEDTPDGVVELCAIVYTAANSIQCPISFPFIIFAEVPSRGYYKPFVFGACDKRNCVNLTITNDELLEETEIFEVTLERTLNLDSRIILEPVTTEINVIDDDVLSHRCFTGANCEGSWFPMATARECCVDTDDGMSYSRDGVCLTLQCIVHGFTSVSYEVTEGETLNTTFDREIKGVSPFPISILGTVNALPITAQEGFDFQALSAQVISESTDISLVTVDDEIGMECEESIRLEFVHQFPPYIIFITSQGEFIRDAAILKVIDNDLAVVGLENTHQRVLVNEGAVEVCVSVSRPSVDCPIEFPFNLTVSTNSTIAAAEMDSWVLMFMSCERRVCVNVTIAEEISHEMMHITLEMVVSDLDCGITLNPVNGIIEIINTNSHVAVLGFTQDTYEVQECNATVFVCVRVFSPAISCPLDRAFNLTLLVTDQTAVSPDDYDAPDFIHLMFAPCQRSICTSDIVIADDEIVEEVETIALILQSPHLDFIRLDPSSATINITDPSDRAEVILENDHYVVTEGLNSSVEVCATISSPSAQCPIDFSFNFCLRIGRYFLLYINFRRCSRRNCSRLFIQNDDKVEDVAQIPIIPEKIMNFDSRISVNSMYSVLEITDDPTDDATVGFMSSRITVLEEDGTAHVCVEITRPDIPCPVEYPFNLIITTADETAEDGSDYVSPSNLLEFESCATRQCLEIEILNDLVLEDDESFNVTLSLDAGTSKNILLGVTTAEVLIIDADDATVGFRSSRITVTEEDGTALVCVEITRPNIPCPVEYPFNLIITTADETAENGSDYVAPSNRLEFESCATRQCLEIVIFNDLVLEDDESFNVTLSLDAGTSKNILLGVTTAKVLIIDADAAVVGLEQVQYSVNEEDGVIEVCAVVSSPDIDCPVDFSFKVKFFTADVTADSQDYTPIENEVLVFAPCQKRSCIDIAIKDDCYLDNIVEVFDILLDRTADLSMNITLNPMQGSVRIYDYNDTATVRFIDTEYTVTEGARFNPAVCAIVEGIEGCGFNNPVLFPFSIYLFTESKTATYFEDFVPLQTIEMFTPNNVALCIDVYIEDDETVEPLEEYFLVRLERTPGLDYRIILEGTVENITIIDTDVVQFHLEETYFKVFENVTDITVCAENVDGIVCPVNFDFNLLFSIDSNSASSDDYTGSDSITVPFPSCSMRECVTIPIINDDILEYRERFTVSLERPADVDERIELVNTLKVVDIFDEDKIVIDFTGATRAIEETMQVCLTVVKGNIDCPSAEPFDLIVFTVDWTAKSRPPAEADYVSNSTVVTFEPCNNQKCLDIEIIDDLRVEGYEVFNVSVVRSPGLDKRIRLANTERTIGIIDVDMIQLKFMTMYFEVEEADLVVICIGMEDPIDPICPHDGKFVVSIATDNRGAVAPGDYTPPNPTVAFNACDNVKCTTIQIEDDCILEDDETFIVKMISTSMPDIKVDSEVVTVNITDKDYLFVGLQYTTVEVYEHKGFAWVCAFILRDCYPSTPFQIRIFTENDSADDPTSDYEPVENGRLLFTPTFNKPCLSVWIIDDKEVEQDESFYMVLERPSGLNERVMLLLGQSRAEVIIKNEDNATLNFEMSLVIVREEHGPAQVCVAVTYPTGLSCPVAYPIYLLISVTNETAIKSIDYVVPPALLRFEACSARECVDIEIIDDRILEANESFSVTFMLDSRASKDILLGYTTTAEVIILDFDELLIGFQQTVYTVDEDQNRTVAVCAEVEGANGDCLADLAFYIVLETLGGSAVEYDDFIPIYGDVLHFGPCDHVQCIVVEIVDDCVLEETEYFYLRLSEIYGLNDRVKVGTGDSKIDVTDTDVVRVGLEFASYYAFEDVRTQQVCVVVKPEMCNSSGFFNISLSTIDDSADSADRDYVAISGWTLSFGPFVSRQCAAVFILDDAKIEQTETFRVSIEVIDDLSGRVQLDGSLATVTIFNDDAADIRLEVNDYRIDEDDGPVELCVKIVSPDIPCPIAFPFDLVFITSDITAVSGRDYRPPTRNLTFGLCETREYFPIEIIDDSLIEETESFNVTLEKSIGLDRFFNILEGSRVETVFIIDNDLAVIGLAQTAYTVAERNTPVTVCVSVFSHAINCPADIPFTLGLIVTARTADSPDDYVSPHFIPLAFARCQRSVCTSDIDIVDDLIVEDSETINLILQNPDPTLINLDPSNAVIIITDSSDKAHVELEESVYLATEGVGAVTVCAIIDRPDIVCPVNFNFKVTLSVGDDDLPIVFLSCAARACTAVTIIDDDSVEDQTEIRIRLERPTDLDSRIFVDTSYSIIKITDDQDDRAVVGLENVSYSYSEEESQPEVCLVVTSPSVQCPICTNFTVMIETTDITADSPQDYRPLSTQVAFNNDCDNDNCETRKCVQIAFVNDHITENIERFRVTLTRTAGLDSRITLSPEEGQVTIINTNTALIQMERTSITVQEDVGTVAVCVAVSNSAGHCPVEYDFTIILIAISDTAGDGSDYVGFSETARFEACETRKCVDVEIIDNCDLEPIEVFYVTLLRNSLDQDIEIGDSQTRIVIIDGDVVNVAMEETAYSVDEDAGQVTVCVTVQDDCLDPLEFFVNLSTVESIANESDDYTAVQVTVRFAGFQNRTCVPVPIVNDGGVEGDETFYISLSEDPSNPLDSRIHLTPSRATVTIIDDDDVDIRLVASAYTVTEASVAAVEVCAEVFGSTSIGVTITVHLSTLPGNATAPSDYDSLANTPLIFQSGDTRVCVSVTINDDTILEETESFTVTLTTQDSRVNLQRTTATITILDTDEF